MKGSPMKLGTIQGTAGHSSALKMKMEKDAAMKMKKKSPMDLNKGFDKLPKEVQAKMMKKDSPTKMKKKSPVKKDKKGLMEKLIPSASTRDKIKKAKRKVGDAITYTKGFTKELLATKGSTISGGKRPGDAGDRALRAKRRGVDVKSAEAIRGRRNRPLKPADKPKDTPEQMRKGMLKRAQQKKVDAKKAAADAKKKKRDEAYAKKFKQRAR